MNDKTPAPESGIRGTALTEWRDLVEKAPQLVFVLDADLRCIAMSDDACAGIGYPREEALGRPITEFFDPEDLGRRPVQIEQLRAGDTVVAERTIRTRTGALLAVEVTMRLLSSDLLVAIARDNTPREARQPQRDAAVEPLHLYSAATHDGIYDVDVAANTAWCSPRLLEIFGRDSVTTPISCEVFLGWVHPEDAPAVARNFEAARAGSGAFTGGEYRAIRPDGRVVGSRRGQPS